MPHKRLYERIERECDRVLERGCTCCNISFRTRMGSPRPLQCEMSNIGDGSHPSWDRPPTTSLSDIIGHCYAQRCTSGRVLGPPDCGRQSHSPQGLHREGKMSTTPDCVLQDHPWGSLHTEVPVTLPLPAAFPRVFTLHRYRCYQQMFPLSSP